MEALGGSLGGLRESIFEQPSRVFGLCFTFLCAGASVLSVLLFLLVFSDLCFHCFHVFVRRRECFQRFFVFVRRDVGFKPFWSPTQSIYRVSSKTFVFSAFCLSSVSVFARRDVGFKPFSRFCTQGRGF